MHFAAPWGMSIPQGEVANFHVVTEGRCWVRAEVMPKSTLLNDGDLVVFPAGDAHTLTDEPDGRALPAKEFLAGGHPAPGGGGTVFGGSGSVCKVICGHFQHDTRPPHPLFASLPPALVIRAGSGPNEWLQTALRLAVLESQSPTMGSPAVTDRLAEVLFIQVLRSFLHSQPSDGGFLAALIDRNIGPVIHSMHRRPEYPWTLAALARIGYCSRSALATRFKNMIGVSPIRYLIEWRMVRARDMLVSTDLTLAAIAARSGYQSEFSFSKAFKRVYGQAPGLLRRNRSSVAG